MNKVDKFLKKLSLEDRIVVEKCLNLIKSGNFTNLSLKKLKGKENKFRVRKGNIRIIDIHNWKTKAFNEGDILVSINSNPTYISLIKKAAAIITDEGGITCHAAIVARELKKPCIIGTKIATKVLKDGDYVEVDADKGIVRKIK